MASFAERFGFRPVRFEPQTESLDGATRNELWNVVTTARRALTSTDSDSTYRQLVQALWTWRYTQPLDELPADHLVWQRVKDEIFDGQWWMVLDVIEDVVSYAKRYANRDTVKLPDVFTAGFNNRFEHFLVGYRFVGVEIAKLDASEEAEAVNAALAAADSTPVAKQHLEKAVTLLSDRTSPDYANSIKESISAVESLLRTITGAKTLSDSLPLLASKGIEVHGGLRNAWSNLYGFTSDAGGVRHGGIEVAEVDQALAKYLLVTCSAFVTYITEAALLAGAL